MQVQDRIAEIMIAKFLGNLIQIADYELVFTLAYICRRLAQRGRIPGENFQHTAFISPNLDI